MLILPSAQAFADSILDGVRSPGFFCLLHCGDKDGKVRFLCETWFEQYDSVDDQVQDARKEASSCAGLGAVASAMEKLCRLFRALGFLLGISSIEATAMDVLYFANYKGKDLFYKSIRDGFTIPSPDAPEPKFWVDLVDEVIKTAGSAASLQPIFDETMKDLKKFTTSDGQEVVYTAASLQTLVHNVQKCRNGLRKSQIEQLDRAALESLLAFAEKHVKEEISSATFETAEMLLNALHLFRTRPGALDKIEAVREWLASSASRVAKLTLAQVAKETNSARTLDLPRLANVLAKLEPGSLDDMIGVLLNFAGDIMNVTFGKARLFFLVGRLDWIGFGLESTRLIELTWFFWIRLDKI